MGASFNKCMYCESIIAHTYYGDVEHIKPKSLYPNLEFEWANLGYVCAICNNEKSDQFFEETPFINPYEEEPSDAILALGTILVACPGSSRGKVTISTIKLNRPAILERRLEKIRRLCDLVELHEATTEEGVRGVLKEEIEQEFSPQREYSYVAKEAYKILNREADA